jgi:NAD(P)-dependent dehydrogenase (short-subunit alcohol dehydrogenase family)
MANNVSATVQALVMAANSDIGRAIGRALAAAGARVLAVARDEERG